MEGVDLERDGHGGVGHQLSTKPEIDGVRSNRLGARDIDWDGQNLLRALNHERGIGSHGVGKRILQRVAAAGHAAGALPAVPARPGCQFPLVNATIADPPTKVMFELVTSALIVPLIFVVILPGPCCWKDELPKVPEMLSEELVASSSKVFTSPRAAIETRQHIIARSAGRLEKDSGYRHRVEFMLTAELVLGFQMAVGLKTFSRKTVNYGNGKVEMRTPAPLHPPAGSAAPPRPGRFRIWPLAFSL